MRLSPVLKVLTIAVVALSSPSMTHAADPNCECRTSFPQSLLDSDLYDEEANCLYYADGATRYCYNISYGLNECSAYDESLDPYCSGLFPPGFCEQSFCFVDISCTSDSYASTYFPGHGLYYSYETCGSYNSFATWIGDDLPHSMTDLIALVEGYALSAKQALEANLQDVRYLLRAGNAEDCILQSACEECSSCEGNECWDQDIDTKRTNVVFNPSLEATTPENATKELACMANYIASTYRRTAAKEYNDEGRIAYQYFGSQDTGAMVQWPALEFCSNDFDARQRPWYASAASGPKDIVIVIDVSGSMYGSRIELARSAAKAVLRTLTWVDNANIVIFDHAYKDRYAASLRPATESEIALMATWIDENVVASGGTDFEEALGVAATMLAESSACSKAILFMTDGEDGTGFDESSLEEVSSDTVIFSYAIGTGATIEPLQTMACATGGIFYPVESEANLPSVMASYYQYFVQLADPCAVSWTRYTDAMTGVELFGGCTAIFDTLANETVLQGVNCVDLNLIVEPGMLQTCNNNAYDTFVDIIKSQAARCGDLASVGGCALSKLRQQVGSSSVCSADSAFSSCGNTNIAYNASSCPAPNPNRFNDIILEGCDADYNSCGAFSSTSTLAPTSSLTDDIAAAMSSIAYIVMGVGIFVVGVSVACVCLCLKAMKKRNRVSLPPSAMAGPPLVQNGYQAAAGHAPGTGAPASAGPSVIVPGAAMPVVAVPVAELAVNEETFDAK
ncbi:Inter-alpha-trypsin inhibitor heavy chain H2 [Hondaea fermentalgiana]|uniref:Inter-alpha-trypsin inhibitor heavy chain H2 n=1 Tax=Hondaea fermentalgiana TaxID=2315210 RepID=A0A2R5GCZ1_9STRA|nr:Inter-alpha-trypsin inhibitor heavy chain H2 [Hondaea fermentalgiana]|eukprot:GBG27568.1 Inter-alpha-trypsin inhibitor heavy chain H2 [Hondaea fermentalgiana]